MQSLKSVFYPFSVKWNDFLPCWFYSLSSNDWMMNFTLFISPTAIMSSIGLRSSKYFFIEDKLLPPKEEFTRILAEWLGKRLDSRTATTFEVPLRSWGSWSPFIFSSTFRQCKARLALVMSKNMIIIVLEWVCHSWSWVPWPGWYLREKPHLL